MPLKKITSEFSSSRLRSPLMHCTHSRISGVKPNMPSKDTWENHHADSYGYLSNTLAMKAATLKVLSTFSEGNYTFNKETTLSV